MFSSRKYEHFVQVSSNHKNIFIMLFDVRCGQESISEQPWYILSAVMVVLPAVTHAFRRDADIKSACCNHMADFLVTLHFIGSSF